MNFRWCHPKAFKVVAKLPLILLIIWMFPCYHSEEVLPINTKSKVVLLTKDIQPTLLVTEEDDLKVAQKAKDLNISCIFLIFSILSLLASTILLTFIWKYLKNVSITKECVLLYLYEDSVGIVLIAGWVWFAIVISCYMSTTGATLGVYQVTVLSFCIITIELQLLLILNIVSAIKLYSMKEMVLDPPIPWGEDDHDAIKKLRVGSWMVILLFVIVMYGCGFYPKPYYYLIGDNRSLLDLPNGPAIFEGFLGILFVVPTITIILTGFYRQKEEQSLATKRNQQFYYLLIIFILIIAAGIIYGIFSSELGSFLIFGQLLTVVGNVIAPLLIIITSIPLNAFTKKILAHTLAKTMASVVNILHNNCPVIDFPLVFRQGPRQIHPII